MPENTLGGRYRQLTLFPSDLEASSDPGPPPADITAAVNLLRSCERTLPLVLAMSDLDPMEREALLRAAKKLHASLGMVLAMVERMMQHAEAQG